jgi:hypothetical protein
MDQSFGFAGGVPFWAHACVAGRASHATSAVPISNAVRRLARTIVLSLQQAGAHSLINPRMEEGTSGSVNDAGEAEASPACIA